MLPVVLLVLIPSLQHYVGTYQIVRAECDDIRPVVERVVSKMNFMIRGIARSRLLRTQIWFPAVTVTSNDSEFRIRHVGGTDVGHSNLITPVNAKAPDGASIQVRLLPGPPLVQRYESADGVRENIYTLSPDGSRLRMDVRIRSPRLPEEIRYKLVYKRVQ
jgi:hypothetical protein